MWFWKSRLEIINVINPSNVNYCGLITGKLRFARVETFLNWGWSIELWLCIFFFFWSFMTQEMSLVDTQSKYSMQSFIHSYISSLAPLKVTAINATSSFFKYSWAMCKIKHSTVMRLWCGPIKAHKKQQVGDAATTHRVPLKVFGRNTTHCDSKQNANPFSISSCSELQAHLTAAVVETEHSGPALRN